ncbi:uncharacterized protein EI90DRAFT_3086015, partial [Cantharellus anzutake]|uniref:uncharacterized protein n=1 Tax=Cantharellus anzutake TaxID=1750568 RepID=UPI0019052CC4
MAEVKLLRKGEVCSFPPPARLPSRLCSELLYPLWLLRSNCFSASFLLFSLLLQPRLRCSLFCLPSTFPNSTFVTGTIISLSSYCTGSPLAVAFLFLQSHFALARVHL